MNILKNEIIVTVYKILYNTSFLNKKNYSQFKCQYLRTNNITRNVRAINLKLKISKFKFKNLNNSGKLNGFYRAIW
jgi:hypothetical protein